MMARAIKSQSAPRERRQSALPAQDADAQRRLRVQQAAALVLILLLAAAARFYRIGDFSLWLDEIWTIETATARGSPHLHLPHDVLVSSPPVLTSLEGAPAWWTIWTRMREMTHPPLYLIVFRWWLEAFGTGAAAVRASSALASLVAVYLLYDVVHVQTGRGAALWAALVMAVAGPQVQFAQEARPYAFIVMLALAAAAALVRIERFGATPARLAGFGAALLALMLTHYFAVGTAAALVGYGMLRTRGKDRRNLLLVTAAAGAVFALSWGPFMWDHRGTFSDENTNFLRDDDPGRVLRTFGRFAALPPRLLSEFLGANPAAMVLIGALCGFAVYLARRRNDLLFWCLWFFATVGVVMLLDLTRSTRHLHFTRYTLLASPAVYAIVALATWRTNQRARHIVPALAALACLITLPQARETMWKANWRELAQIAQQHRRPSDVLVVAGDDALYTRSSYLCLSHYLPPPPPPFVLATDRVPDALLAQLRAAPGVLMLTWSDRDPSPHLRVLGECHGEFIAGASGAGALMRITWAAEPDAK